MAYWCGGASGCSCEGQEDGRLRRDGSPRKSGVHYRANLSGAMDAWAHIARALDASDRPEDRPEDRRLSGDIARFVRDSPAIRDRVAEREPGGRTAAEASQRRQPRDRGA